MCNSYEQRVGWAAYKAAMLAIEMEIAGWNGEADLPQSDLVRISDTAPVMRLAGEAVELAQMQFGFPPLSPKGGPVFNFRSEGRRFADSNRCLIPASAFFEFSGTKYPKTKHRFTLNDAPFLAIAGIWREGKGNQPPAFTMLTTEPGSDVLPYHNRQIVGLRPAEWAEWLRLLTKPAAELLQPLPAGALTVETVRRGSDSFLPHLSV